MIWLGGLWTLFKRVPREVWIITAALAAIALYGNHRETQGYAEAETIWQAKAAKLEAERAAALASEEEALRTLAKRTDENAEQARVENDDRTERFIRSGGVRPKAPACRGDTPDRSAGSGETVREAPELDDPDTVSVTPDDVRICTTNTITAEALRAFVLGLEG